MRVLIIIPLTLALGASGCVEDAELAMEQVQEEAAWRRHDPGFCEQIFSFEHVVETQDGAVLRVVERFTPASVLQFPRRAIVMLPGTLVTGEMWDIQVPSGASLSALDQAARAGFFAFSVTYEGYPGSSLPEDGSTVTAERSLAQMGEIVEWVRHRRAVWRVDLMGASLGSSLAVALGGTESPVPRWHVGRIVLQALVYKQVTPLFQAVFFSPEVRALLENAPGGYVLTSPEMYGLILASSDPEAAGWGFENYPDLYATGPTLEGFDLPVFDAAYGRAPALQLWGDQDLITPFADVQQFQQEYGGDAELRILPGAGHAPYTAEEELREVFWTETLEFLDYNPFRFFLACDPS